MCVCWYEVVWCNEVAVISVSSCECPCISRLPSSCVNGCLSGAHRMCLCLSPSSQAVVSYNDVVTILRAADVVPQLLSVDKLAALFEVEASSGCVPPIAFVWMVTVYAYMCTFMSPRLCPCLSTYVPTWRGECVASVQCRCLWRTPLFVEDCCCRGQRRECGFAFRVVCITALLRHHQAHIPAG